MKLMDDQFIDFLIKAKRSTYAAKGAEVQPSRPNSHDLQYIEGDFVYIDTYLGGKKFAGEEAVWKNNAPLWAMNYVGRVVGEGFSGDFLKEALLLVPRAAPFRGSSEYSSGEYIYRCSITGELDWFNGYEEIYKRATKVYECFFHGGQVI